MDNSQMGMFDPLGNSMNTPSSVHHQQQHSQHSQGTPHHPHQNPQQNYQQNQHFNSNMSNNQHIEQKHNPVGSWQRGGWDSGIQSGATSQTPSIISGHSDLSAIVSEFSEHIPDFQNTTVVPAHHPGQQPPSDAQLAAQQASVEMQQMFDFQDEEGLATGIPKLIGYLKSNDTVVVRQASQVIHQFSKREHLKVALITNRDIIPSLILVLGNTNDPETARATTGALHNASQTKQGREHIFQSGGIPSLVKVLACSVDAVVFYAITTIHNLLLHIKSAKSVVRDTANAIHQMVSLLKMKQNVKFLAICTDCLHLLGYGCSQAKVQMVQAEASVQLVHIMNTYTYEKLLWTTSRVLKVLSCSKDSKLGIVHAGGFQALGNHLNNPSQRLVTNCLWTMRNLSDAATSLPGLSNIINILVQKLQSEDVQTVGVSSGILANLTCNNQQNKTDTVKFNGIESLLRAIMNAGDRQEVTEPAVCCLRHITCRHNEIDLANQKVREAQGLTILMKYLMPGQAKYPLRKAVLGLLRNLATNVENRNQLINQMDLINVLMSLLQSLIQPFFQQSQQQPDRESQQLIDASIQVMAVFANDHENVHKIKNNDNLMQTLIGMLRIPALQTTSGTLLGSMCTVDPSVVNYLKEVGCLQLIEQIHQANMQRRKQQEQRQRHLQQQQWEQQQQQMNPAAYNMPQMAYPDAGSGHPPGPPPPGAPHGGHPMTHPGMTPNGQPNYDPNYSGMGGGHPPPTAGGHPMHPDYHHSQSQGIHPQPQTPQDVHPMPMSNWFEPM